MNHAVSLLAVVTAAAGCDRVFGIGDPYEDARASSNGSDAATDTQAPPIDSVPADASLASQAIVHFPFDSDMLDTQNHSVAVCLRGTCVPTIGGHVGVGSLAMSNNGCVKYPLPQMPARWSVALWVYPNVSTQQTVTARQYAVSSSHMLWEIDGSATSIRVMTFDGSDQMLFGSGQLQTNAWQHLVITYDGMTLVFYRNTTVETMLTTTISAAGTPEAFLGCDVGGSSGFFTGNIDDVYFYDRALTPAEVTELYNLGA